MKYQFLQNMKKSIVIALSLLPISAFCQIRINNALYYYFRCKWLAIHSRWSEPIDVFDILPSIEEDRATVPCTRFSCKYFLINRSIVRVQRQQDPHYPFPSRQFTLDTFLVEWYRDAAFEVFFLFFLRFDSQVSSDGSRQRIIFCFNCTNDGNKIKDPSLMFLRIFRYWRRILSI